MKKRILGIVLAIMMVVSLFPFTAFSANAEEVETECLNFTAVNGRVSIQLSQLGETLDYNLEYKINDGSWKQWNDPETNAVDIPKDGTIYLRKSGEEIATVFGRTFVMKAKDEGATVTVAGNVMSLLDKTCESVAMGEYCFRSLFKDCDIITSAENMILPAMELEKCCYFDMFDSCVSLVTAPALPATKLAPECYAFMFDYCLSLTNAPMLPATELVESCYYNMFTGCESLVTAPALPAMSLAYCCYRFMFENCLSLKNAPTLPATELETSCYENMFDGCVSLNIAPALPAKTLENSCYYEMFKDCSSLSRIEIWAEDWLDDYTATYNWVSGVPSSGTFIYTNNLNTAARDASHVPEGWTLETGYKVNTEVTGEGTITTSSTIEEEFNSVSFSANPFSDEYALKSGFPKVINEEGQEIPLAKNQDGYYTFDMPNSDVTIYAEFIWAQFANEFNITAEGKKGDEVLVAVEFPVREGDTAGSTPVPLEYRLGTGRWTKWNETKTIKLLSGQTLYLRKEGEPVTKFGGTFKIKKTEGSSDAAGVSVAGNIMTLLDSTGNSMNMDSACFAYLFNRCSLLKSAKDLYLPAMTLTKECYSNMFAFCKALESAPALPATTIAERCYERMFYDCSGLKTVTDKLPATELAESCYSCMFWNCELLKTAPALPATTLAKNCYNGMFLYCESLEKAPELPATELAEWCYQMMFGSCKSLKIAPTLPAVELTNGCYFNMFEDCTNLSQIKVGFTNWLEEDTGITCATKDWLKNVAKTGEFICPAGLNTELVDSSHIPSGWNANSFHQISTNVRGEGSISTSDFLGVEGGEITFTLAPLAEVYVLDEGYPTVTKGDGSQVDVTEEDGTYKFIMPDADVTINAQFVDSRIPRDYLNFTATGGAVEIGFAEKDGNLVIPKYNLQYKINNGNWFVWEDMANPIIIEDGEKLFLRKYGDETAIEFGGRFKMTHAGEGLAATVSVEGNIMSLLDDTCAVTEMAPSCFLGLFKDCTILKSAEKLSLPAMTLSRKCYDSMFAGCTALEKGPALPATVMADGSYYQMFYRCHSLIAAPELPAMTLTKECYSNMFAFCEALESAPALPATTIAERCYERMFYNCSGLKTVTDKLPATELAESCYSCMFWNCELLKTAPALPATTLAKNCYNGMFLYCESLEKAPELPATELAEWCYQMMFGYCKSLEIAPTLPAVELTNGCYFNMFKGCTNLNQIKVGFTSWLETNTGITCATKDWVGDVAENGTFICPAELSTSMVDTYHVPQGWTTINGYKVSVPSTINGKVETDKTIATAGEDIRFTVAPSVSCVIKPGFPKVTYVEAGETKYVTDISEENGTYQFEMPEADVTIICEFEEIGLYWGYNSDEKTLYLSGAESEEIKNCEENKKGRITSDKVDLTKGQPWMKGRLALGATTVIIQSEIRPGSTAGWFKDMKNITSISGLEKIIGSESMKSMFEGCKSLTTIATTSLDVKKTTNMKNMFKGCSSLIALDLSSFNMAKVTATKDIIARCSSLEEIKTPKNLQKNVSLPTRKTWYDEELSVVTRLPKEEHSVHEYTVTVYEVSFDANGGSGQMPSVKIAKPYGRECIYKLPTVTETTFTPPEENKYAKGWGIKNEDGTITQIEGSIFTLTGDVTLYTIWGTYTAAFEAYKLDKIAECENMKEPSDTTEITDLISAAMQSIEELTYDYDKKLPENLARVDEIVEPLKIEVYALRLAQAKENAKAEIDNIAGDESGQSAAVKALVTEAKNSIDAASTLEKVDSRKEKYIEKILNKASEEAAKIINEAAGNKPSEVVKAIVEKAIELISEANTVPEINEIRDDALEKIYKQREAEGLDKYEIIKGMDANFYLNDPKDIEFTSNAPYGKFLMVLIDGNEISGSNYTVKEGSTIVTLKADYIKNCSVGKHSITIVSNDGKGSENFNIYEYKPVTGDLNNPLIWIMTGIVMLLCIMTVIMFESKNKEKKK